MHLCRRGPRGRSLLKPCMGPRASLSCLMYVTRGPLPVGVGLPPEARLNRPALSAVFAACQTVWFLRASLAEDVGYIWGVCFTATGCL